jgi:hypothetical protein
VTISTSDMNNESTSNEPVSEPSVVEIVNSTHCNKKFLKLGCDYINTTKIAFVIGYVDENNNAYYKIHYGNDLLPLTICSPGSIDKLIEWLENN